MMLDSLNCSGTTEARVANPGYRSDSKVSQSTESDQPPVAPKPRANPFGAARPREEVLKEKGFDPVALDAGHRSPLGSEAGKSDVSSSSRPTADAKAEQPGRGAGQDELSNIKTERSTAVECASLEHLHCNLETYTERCLLM